jgi:hypothetical protein
MISSRFVPLIGVAVLCGVLTGCGVANGSAEPSAGDTPSHLSLARTQLHFGNVKSGSTVRLTEHIQNTSPVPVTIYAASVQGKGFRFEGPGLPLTVAPAAGLSFTVAFTPPLAGEYTGSLNLKYNWPGDSNGSSQAVEVFGTARREAAPISAALPVLDFGAVGVAGNRSIIETLTNRSQAALTISQITITGREFSFTGLDLPMALGPGHSVSFPVIFAPTLSGESTGSLSVQSDVPNSAVSVALGGMGATQGRLTLNPASVNFGNVVVGAHQDQTVTLFATAGSVTVSSADINNSEFSISGISLPTTIVAGGRTSLTLTFSPQSSGTATGILALNGGSPTSRTIASMVGTGSQPQQHSVDLVWDPSTSSDVVGYNVYRGTQSGGPYSPITSAPETNTNDTDNTVSGGQTYYYVVTAVNGNSEESAYSNEERAVIPSP